MSVGTVARVIAVLAAVVAAAGSAASNQDQQNPSMMTSQYAQPGYSPPPPRAMDAARALGLWKSNFGAVKLEADDSRGGIAAGAVHGIWVYRNTAGQEVIGYFNGNLRGNVLRFSWQEPPLTGEGYLSFQQSGQQFTGRWWSNGPERRVGDWYGSRHAGPVTPGEPGEASPNPFEGRPDADPAGREVRDPDAGEPGEAEDPYARPRTAPAQPNVPQPDPRYY